MVHHGDLRVPADGRGYFEGAGALACLLGFASPLVEVRTLYPLPLGRSVSVISYRLGELCRASVRCRVRTRVGMKLSSIV